MSHQTRRRGRIQLELEYPDRPGYIDRVKVWILLCGMYGGRDYW